MRLSSIAILLAMVVACGGDDGTPAGDAGDDIDSGPPCTGAVYDSCADTTGSTDCMDGLACHEFESAGLILCIPTCDANNPCPDQDGATVTCNMMGRCRPEAANDCSLP